MNKETNVHISLHTSYVCNRDKNLQAHIIAITFTGKITNEVQNHLQGFEKKII